MNAEGRTARVLGRIVRVLRTIFWALLFAFAVGFVIGTFLRREIDRPVRYIGGLEEPTRRVSVRPVQPGNIVDALPCILVPSHHEEQVG